MERFYRENAATGGSASLSDGDGGLSSDESSEAGDENGEKSDELRIARVAWTVEEDRQLTRLVHKEGASNWSSKAAQLGTGGRSVGAVRLRWSRQQRKAEEEDDGSDPTEDEEDDATARSAANAEQPAVADATIMGVVLA